MRPANAKDSSLLWAVMKETSPTLPKPPPARVALLYHFCRLQLPFLQLAVDVFTGHLRRTFALFQSKSDQAVCWDNYFDRLYPVDWYLAVGCLEGIETAWECLFSARANRTDCLLVDALRARAARLYPGDEEKQDAAVSEFWSQLLVSETADGMGVLARYDGQRPLVPWLIRVFQNWHISQLRQRSHLQPLPDDDIALPLPEQPNGRWHEPFCRAARDWLNQLGEMELLILGLRIRYRQTQREVAQLLGVHEGTISRQITQLRHHCLEHVQRRLAEEGWVGEDLSSLMYAEMGNLLLDEPKLSADRLAEMLSKRGRKPPQSLQ
ncbi:MAG: hypothetical protein KatS3mg105_1757 [Gemmatales bacterium]|nr:MAG: hypothetical protein KatS3mg105_1757 [Gemmatales bacterium]